MRQQRREEAVGGPESEKVGNNLFQAQQTRAKKRRRDSLQKGEASESHNSRITMRLQNSLILEKREKREKKRERETCMGPFVLQRVSRFLRNPPCLVCCCCCCVPDDAEIRDKINPLPPLWQLLLQLMVQTPQSWRIRILLLLLKGRQILPLLVTLGFLTFLTLS